MRKSTTNETNPLQEPTAKNFMGELMAMNKKVGAENAKFVRADENVNRFLNVPMSNIFSLAKQFMAMPLKEIEALLDNDLYEARVGAVSIMDFQARDKKVSEESRKALFELYINHHDRIDNWDLVDRSAPYVVGGYLSDKPRKILYKLAKSKNVWERRTAIVATYFFIRQNDLDDTFNIAELLVNDKHDMVNKAVGSWVREAGKRDHRKLIAFLDKHAATMPRITLRYAIEKLDKKLKDHYLNMSKITP